MHFRLTFSNKLFLSIILLFWLFAGCFTFYQYTREKEYKIELLNDRLAIFNSQLCEMLHKQPVSKYEALIDTFVHFSHIKNLRITLIAPNGRIIYDNQQPAGSMKNHSGREEVIKALRYGSGYSIMRTSETMNTPFFYYASYFKDSKLIIRCALPYDFSLSKRLKADMNYLWGILLITFVLTFVFYKLTARLGNTITQLRLFAKKADMDEPFELKQHSTGDNELDMIARHIVDIYYRLRRTKDELYIAREKLIAHLQISNEGLAIFNPKREVILSNALFTQYANLIIDKNIESIQDVFNIPEFGKLIQFIEDTCKDYAMAESKMMTEVIDRNGYIFSIDAVVFQDASFELTICDITKQEEQARMKRQITQNMAHELKTPVSSIQGYLETIINNPELPQATMNQFLQRSFAQSQRLTNLLRDITALTRLDEASSLIDVELLDLSQIIRNIVSELALPLEEKQMTVTCSFPDNMMIDGNFSLLYSIFRNLTDNAIAYAGVGKKITISCIFEDEDFYFFSFKDNGVGVDPSHLPRLFERFYRVDKGRSRKIGGTGLGLAIVKNAIIFHGGTVHAKQVANGGLEFIFMLKKKHNAVLTTKTLNS